MGNSAHVRFETNKKQEQKEDFKRKMELTIQIEKSNNQFEFFK